MRNFHTHSNSHFLNRVALWKKRLLSFRFALLLLITLLLIHVSPSLSKDNYKPEDNERLKAISSSLHYPLTKKYPITSPFGWRIHPVLHIKKYHEGLDIGAPEGDKVFAAMTGKVIVAEFQKGGGNTVILEHNEDLRTVYCHLSKIAVSEGQTAEQGTLLGLVGQTGYLVTGPHLHFGVSRREGGEWEATNPLDWFGKSVKLPSPPTPPEKDTALIEQVENCEERLWGKCKEPPPPPCGDRLWDFCKDKKQVVSKEKRKISL